MHEGCFLISTDVTHSYSDSLQKNTQEAHMISQIN